MVLAAGMSTRFRRPPKQLLKIGKRTLLETVVGKFWESMVDEVIVVLGYDSNNIQQNSSLGQAKVVINTEYRRGMGTSIRKGIEAVAPGSGAAILALGDQPLLSVASIDAIVQKYLETGGPVVAPYFRGRRGNPVLFARESFPHLMRIQGDRGAKAFITKQGWKVVKVPVRDSGVLFDVDSEADYEEALRRLRNSR